MKKVAVACMAMGWILAVCGVSHAALVWGVDPSANGNELVNIDPFTGAVNRSFSLSGLGIQASDTKVGLAGGTGGLYYTNGNLADGKIHVIDPGNGETLKSFAVSEPEWWGMDGLGTYANGDGEWLLTSGCKRRDIHRYDAADGTDPRHYWADPTSVSPDSAGLVDPLSVAGDTSGRIFVCAMPNLVDPPYGIYEVDPLHNDTVPTFFAASPGDDSIVGMAYDGTYLYLSDSHGSLYTMDNSGQLVNTVNLDHPLYALGCTPETCNAPAPGALLLAGLGVVFVGVVRSRWILA